MSEIIIGIDLGSNILRIIAGCIELGKREKFEIIGRSYTSKHLSSTNAGNIVNIEKVKSALKEIVNEVEVMIGREIVKAFVGGSSNLVKGFPVLSDTPIQGKHKTVSKDDTNRVIENARQTNMPKEYISMHIIPSKFLVDNQGVYENPIGAKGSRLSVEAYSIALPKVVLNNITSVCNNIGITVAKPIFEPLAGAETALFQNERDAGVLYIDIGYETTQSIIVKNSFIKHLFVQPFASKHITSDLMEVINVNLEDAEKLKKKMNLAEKLPEGEIDEGVEIKVAGTGTKKVVRKSFICEVIWARVFEIFSDIKKDLENHKLLESFPGGVVIGGGGAKLLGIDKVAKEVFGVNCRIAVPTNITGLSEEIVDPSWVTAVGILQFGYNYFPEECIVKRGFFSRLFKKDKRREL